MEVYLEGKIESLSGEVTYDIGSVALPKGYHPLLCHSLKKEKEVSGGKRRGVGRRGDGFDSWRGEIPF